MKCWSIIIPSLLRGAVQLTNYEPFPVAFKIGGIRGAVPTCALNHQSQIWWAGIHTLVTAQFLERD